MFELTAGPTGRHCGAPRFGHINARPRQHSGVL